MKRNSFVAIAVLAIIILCTACSNSNTTNEGRENTKLADNLYGIEYDDYDFDACVDFYGRHKPKGLDAACSEVRKGNFIGRNLDYYINRNACAVIKMNHSKHRFASIGVVGCCPEFTTDVASGGKPNEIYRYLPCRTSDGINEKGVYIGVNVMPTGETSFDKKKWRAKQWGIGAAFTKPGAKHTYNTMYLTRYVLDNATSVEHALTLIRSINWYEPVDYPHKGEAQAFHWMLADGKRNCIIEFIDNQLEVTEADDLNQPSFGTIMTNFTNALYAKGIMQYYGIGYERFDVLKANYAATPASMDGMGQLMKKVWFSKAYTTPIDSPDLWLGEYVNEVYPSWDLYPSHDLLERESLRVYLQGELNMWNVPNNWYTDNTPLWFTVHTSIYDLGARKLQMMPHEGRGAQKSFIEFSLSSRFNKPCIK